ncbi:inorganic phosphate transporter [Nostoc sp. FACHB-152]|uniref:inorganic phosphate transporter n=1 Tax=unclassified Nostoc TaxID=2593658 RepID=UPI001686F3E1|nr:MULTISPECIES: inorganic phosphate transporter [unclassified Nostoc]MBD2446524.1 inorganic phosphate transporter [Nostoc sp. FACHB-152]MBD2468679.1 inorganic phosphate transporter [Nostoc sp. FACHB-145]
MPMTLVIVVILAFYVAFNLGANDVANAMGTSVGSKAVTLKQAIIIAGVLEFTGAVLFGHEVSETLATKVANPNLFAATPQLLVTGMMTVLISCGVWLQIATAKGLPVSSSHAVVGAIAGFSAVAMGIGAIDWPSIGMITIGWIVTPIISGSIAALFYSQIKRWILDQPNQVTQLREWIPWLSSALLGVFGVIVLPSLTQPLTNFLIEKVGIDIPAYDIPLFTGALAAVGLTLISWRQLEVEECRGAEEEYITSHSPFPTPIERLFGRFQLLSACFVAFAHGSNDVGNAIAPLAAIVYINTTGNVPINGITIPVWILVVGGAGIVAGLAIWGKKVIATIGENIIALQPSSGFCAELATATTILLASRLGLPVSTSHALVGGVVGIGMVQSLNAIKFQTLQSIAAAWLITVPLSAVLSASIFSLARIFWY